MRHKRAKTYKRLMAVYVQTFGFRQPFQVLVSNDLLVHASGNKDADLPRQIQACVQGPIKPMITQCCMESLYKLGRDQQRTTDLAKSFERRKCNHRTALEPDACLKDMIGETNKHNYVLATQSSGLRDALELVPGLPVLHFNRSNVLVLSPPGRATLRKKDEMESERRVQEDRVLDGVEEGENVVGAGSTSARASGSGSGNGGATRGKKVKGPNPLSMKKKAKAPAAVASGGKGADGHGEGDGAEAGAGRRKRRRPDQPDRDGDSGAEALESGAGGADGQEGRDQARKKRKRKHKGAMAQAREETAVLFGRAQGDTEARQGDGPGDGSSDTS